MAMEEWFTRIMTITLDIGCKGSSMALELLLVLNYFMKEIGKREKKYFNYLFIGWLRIGD